MKRILAVLTVLVLLTGCCAAAETASAPETAAPRLEEKAFPGICTKR